MKGFFDELIKLAKETGKLSLKPVTVGGLMGNSMAVSFISDGQVLLYSIALRMVMKEVNTYGSSYAVQLHRRDIEDGRWL